jgi:signal transduction histidine kinase
MVWAPDSPDLWAPDSATPNRWAPDSGGHLTLGRAVDLFLAAKAAEGAAAKTLEWYGMILRRAVRGLGEEIYLEQVVRNLLTNAAKYSEPGTSIVVEARAPDEVVVRVLDEGVGIAEADIAHVFELFYRSAAVTRKAAGAGIGLFVSRQLIEAMGGRMWATSRPEGGAEVGFAMPHHPLDDEAF